MRSVPKTRHLVDVGDEAEKASPWFPQYVGKELLFIADVLGLRHHRTRKILAWEFQRYLVKALFKYRRVSVFGARGVGKDFIAAYIVLAFMYTAPSRVITLGPGMRHLKTVLWSEMANVFHNTKVPLQGEMTTMSLTIDDRHFALGIPCKDPDSVRGPHSAPEIGGDPDADELDAEDIKDLLEGAAEATRLLIIIDEPQSLIQAVFDVLRGMVNKDNVFVLMIGNATLGLDENHEYVHTLTQDLGYHTIKVSVFPESKYPDPNSDRYSKVFDHVPLKYVNQESRDKAERLLTPTDPVFMSDMLGQFCSGSTDQLVITPAILRAAMASYETMDRLPLGPRIGFDVGTGNPDPCTASLFVDGVKRAGWEWRPQKDDKQTRITTATEFARLMVDWGKMVGEHFPDSWDGSPITGNRCSIDDTSNPGICDILWRMGIPTDRVNFSSRPDGHWPSLRGNFRFLNKRAEMHWLARCGLQEGIFCIDTDKFPKSAEEACWALYERDTDGMGTIIRIEKKVDIKKRHGRSPDWWDADILAMRQTTDGKIARTAGDGHVKRKRRSKAPLGPGWSRI